MERALRKTLADGVQLTVIPTDKFKTSVMRVALLLPLGGKMASAFAALAPVLRRGTKKHSNMQEIGSALDALYGARVEPITRKVGDNLAIGFVSDVINETYTKDGKGLTAQAAKLLCEFLSDPILQNNVFLPKYVDNEKENLAVRIEAMKNDPRSYAQRRVIEIMCEQEAFGQSEYGTADGARALDATTLYKAYQYALQNARIELFYCGSMEPQAVEEAFSRALSFLPHSQRYAPKTIVKATPHDAVRTVVEEMNVRQGKLSIGLRTGITASDDTYPAMALADSVFGGSTSSKLFLNVREKMSLCYYAASGFNKHNGVMTVASGIENKNFDIARDAILKQLRDLQTGSVSDDEIESARKTMCSMLCSTADSPLGLERFWLGQSVMNLDWDMDALAQRMQTVTRDQVIAAAQCVKTDTVYFLKGVGE